MIYNLPADIDPEDVIAVDSWFDENFKYNEDATFYLQLNPICDLVELNMTDIVAPAFEKFLLSNNTGCEISYEINIRTKFCRAPDFGNGRCDLWFS